MSKPLDKKNFWRKIIFFGLIIFLVIPSFFFFVFNFASALGDVTTGYRLSFDYPLEFIAHDRIVSIDRTLSSKDIFIPTRTEAELTSFCNSGLIGSGCDTGYISNKPDCGTVDYGGIVYPTVQIGSQCWLAKDLNIGTPVSVSRNMSSGATIEKYCEGNNTETRTADCDKFGGLYQWNEAMNYTTTEGAQGICPPGWHIPTDAEFVTFENTLKSLNLGDSLIRALRSVDSFYYAAYGTSTAYSGSDPIAPRGLNSVGFFMDFGGVRASAHPYIMRRSSLVPILSTSLSASYWTSTQINTSNAKAWGSYVFYNGYWHDSPEYPGYNAGFNSQNSTSKNLGYSIRCLKD